MSTRRLRLWHPPIALGVLLAGCLIVAADSTARAQFVQRQVGGVSINADGVLKNLTVDEQGELRREMEKALQPVAGDMATKTEMRKISLRQLEAAIAAAKAAGKPLPDEIRYLAGLQRVSFVFVVPEQQDIVLAGPAEGWVINAEGEVVGSKSGQPVLLLDDLLVALRTANNSNQGAGISCSIDPSADGLARLRSVQQQMKATVVDDSNAQRARRRV